MMSALKMTADRIAERGVCRFMMFRRSSTGITPENIAGMIAKYLATSLAIENVVSDAAGDEQLLADLDDLDELRRVRVEVDHVPGLLRGLRAGVHGHADVGLGEGGSVVGAVTGHRDEPAARLLLADQVHLVLGRRLGEEVVDAGLGGDRLRGQRVVAGDHDRADAHGAQLVEAVADALLDDVLQVDDAEDLDALGDDERRAAARRHAFDDGVEPGGHLAALLDHPALHRLRGALAHRLTVEVDAAHAGLGGEGDSVAWPTSRSRMSKRSLASTDDRAALGRLVGQARELRRGGESLLGDARERQELCGLAVAERDGAGLVEQQRRAVTGGLDARPDIASTLCCTRRSMPAMPIAESSAPIVVGMRHTSSATSTMIVCSAPANTAKGCRVPSPAGRSA